MKKTMRPFPVWLPRAAARKLRVEAANRDISRHRLMQTILLEWIGNQEQRIQQAT